MISFYRMILCVLVRTRLSYEYAVDFTLNITKHVTAMYGDCVNISYEYTIPWNASLAYKRVWFREVSDTEKAPINVSQDKFLRLPLLPPGEHRFRLRLEWAHERKRHTFAETVQVQVTALKQLPNVVIDNNPMEGRNTTLQCTAPRLCHNESSKLTWVGENVLHRRSEIMFNQKTSTIQITLKAEDHNTNITCQLQYKYTMTNMTVTLKVQYSPKILSSSKCILKDNKVFCRCVSHGNPRPTINWTSPCGSYQSTNTSNDSETVEEIVHIQGSDYCNSTIQCVSSNSLGSAKMDLKTQNLTNWTAQLNSIGMGGSVCTLTVPWAITGGSLSLSLVIFIILIIVIYQYKQIRKKKCSEEVNMYASLRKTSVEQDYSVISLDKIF